MRQMWRAPAGALICAVLTCGPAAAQKSGGILRIEHIDNPPSASIHEEGTASVVIPFMAMFNNLVLYDQHMPQHGMDSIRPELATAWAWTTPGRCSPSRCGRREVARRQAVHRRRREVHLGSWLASRRQEAAQEPARGLVHQPGEGHRQRADMEVRFHSKRAQPSFLALLAAGWSPVYPCHVPGQRHAHEADRHRAFQVGRVQAERRHPSGEEPRLLEEGAALPRRHRVSHHAEPRDPHAGLRLRRVRHDATPPTSRPAPARTFRRRRRCAMLRCAAAMSAPT